VPIPRSIVRRVNRVRQRTDPANEDPEEILDDIFVLWRAFEATWSGKSSERNQAEEAVVEAIRGFGISAVPRVKTFVESLRAFMTASPEEIVEWFGAGSMGPLSRKTQILSEIRSLRDATKEPTRWTAEDSKRLGGLLYRLRCAVVHPSLNTDNRLTVPILPRLRAALIELIVTRSARQASLALDAAWQQFDSTV
jgi:hypothetical protein